MTDLIPHIAEWCALLVELLGIAVITVIAAYVVVYGIIRLLVRRDASDTVHAVRHRLGRGILLGLELLVAADIIHTVAVDLSFTSVGVLGLIVIIRTFLSFTLEVELTGRWPWQEQRQQSE